MTPNGTAPLIAAVAASAKAPAYRLASRVVHPEDSVVWVRDVPVGTRRVVVMAGPCAVEDRTQLLESAWAVKESGGSILRGGRLQAAYLPLRLPGTWRGRAGATGRGGEATGLPAITEVTDSEDVDLVARYADCLQIGSRNMSAFRLLRRVGAVGQADHAEARLSGRRYVSGCSPPSTSLPKATPA